MESNSETVTIVDKTAISLSLLCLLHCLLLPLFVPVLPFLVAVEEISHFHEIFAVLVLAMAFFAFWRGYRLHGHKSIFIFGILGGCMLSFALLLPAELHAACTAHGHEHSSLSHLISPQGLLTSLGGITLILAHLFNIRECRCTIADNDCHCAH